MDVLNYKISGHNYLPSLAIPPAPQPTEDYNNSDKHKLPSKTEFALYGLDYSHKYS